MQNFDENLQKVLISIQELKKNGQKGLCVYDLDSTIFNVTQRTQRILRDLASSETVDDIREGLGKALEKVEVYHDEWGIKEALLRIGIDEIEVGKQIRKHWSRFFFSSDYLLHDRPYEGAVEFVVETLKSGAEIKYLTGRHVATMERGTLDSLKEWDLPRPEIGNAELIMKPKASDSDTGYKIEVLRGLVGEFDKIWFFENEPVIVNEVCRVLPEIEIVFMDSVHSGREEVEGDHTSIKMKYYK